MEDEAGEEEKEDFLHEAVDTHLEFKNCTMNSDYLFLKNWVKRKLTQIRTPTNNAIHRTVSG